MRFLLSLSFDAGKGALTACVSPMDPSAGSLLGINGGSIGSTALNDLLFGDIQDWAQGAAEGAAREEEQCCRFEDLLSEELTLQLVPDVSVPAPPSALRCLDASHAPDCTRCVRHTARQ